MVHPNRSRSHTDGSAPSRYDNRRKFNTPASSPPEETDFSSRTGGILKRSSNGAARTPRSAVHSDRSGSNASNSSSNHLNNRKKQINFRLNHGAGSLRTSKSASSLPGTQNKRNDKRNRASSAAGRYNWSTEFRVVITGFSNLNTTSSIILGFLRRQTDKQIGLIKHYLDGDRLLLELATSNDVQLLLSMNEALFCNQKLFINEYSEPFFYQCPPGLNEKFQTRFTVLLIAVKENYDAANNALDLANFTTDARLLDQELDFTSPKIREMISKMIQIEEMKVEHLSLSGNEISDLSGWGFFFEEMPKLKTLVLADNNIETISNMRLLASDLFPELTSLDLRGNPIYSGPLDKYKKILMKKIPTLLELNGTKCSIARFAIGEATTTPDEMPVRSDLYDTDQTQQLVISFLGAFFGALDGNIDQLEGVYHPEAVFSYSLPNHKRFQSYHSNNRNLKHLKKSDNIASRLHIGPQEILRVLRNLPKTEHKKESMVVDAWASSDLAVGVSTIQIFVHGNSVAKLPSRVDFIHSFDRTIVLLVSAPQTGQPINCQIIHDMLILRHSSSTGSPWSRAAAREAAENRQKPVQLAMQPALTCEASLVLSNAVAGIPAAPDAPPLTAVPPCPPEMTREAYTLVLQAMHACGLTWDGAILCLHETNGNIEQILRAKAENKIESTLMRLV